MGIKGMNKFITKFEKHIIDRIDMREEIENWKIDHDGDPPMVLIDLKEFPHIFLERKEMGFILGGQYDLYNKTFRNFFNQLRDTKVKLVFFMSGFKNTDDLQFFLPRREEDYAYHLNILDTIHKGDDLKAFIDTTRSKDNVSNIRMSLVFEHNLKRVCRHFGDFRVNYYRHNQEIARFARDHADQVLAIITNDTDFLAFEGKFQFWRAYGINKYKLECSRYCKNKLKETLELEPHQMQLLSALSGSHYLPHYVITHFIVGLISENPARSSKIWNLAKYVKRQTLEIVNGKPKYDLKKISCDVFGENYTLEQLNSIANGLSIYDLDFKEPEKPQNSFVNFSKTHDSFIYKLITDDIFKIRDIDYIDFRNYKSNNYAELILPILMKLCGILNKDNRIRPATREICMKHAHDEPFKVTKEKIIYPPRTMRLPPLFDITFKNKEHEIDDDRWSLLAWVLDFDNDFIDKIRENIQRKSFKEYCAVVITLNYLLKQEEFTVMEANGILCTEQKFRANVPPPVEDSHPIKSHLVRVAHLYVKMYVLISHCMDVCGFHALTDLIKFNGPFFHKTMAEFENATTEEMSELLSPIKPIWEFA